MKALKNNWHKLALLIIVLLTAFLNFYAVVKEGYANEYYSAAVKSMMASWHNFFFASFDPGGYVTVDKPALGLWFQTVSALIFGFHGWSLILPEALAAVVSVCIIYHLVERSFGRAAGIAAALVLSLTPILIAVSRTNNLDSSLVMVLLFAAWALIAASEKGSSKLLFLSMSLVGLGFNIKMLEAYLVLPAFYLVYIFTAHINIKKRILHLTQATAILLAVSLSWALIVDITPSSMRPYIGSSRTNYVIELALGYNGIQRLTGNRTFGTQDTVLQEERSKADMVKADSSGKASISVAQTQDERKTNENSTPGQDGENGSKGLFRIFNTQLAGQISWLLPFALFGIIVLSLRVINRKSKNRENILRHLILWSAWIIPMIVYFSIAGFFHKYYLSMLAPGIAALAGISIVETWRSYMESGWKWVLLPVSLIITAAIQCIVIYRYPDWRTPLMWAICAAIFIASTALVIIRILKKDNLVNTIKTFASIGFAALLIAPAIWSYTPIMYGSQTTMPYAGPELKRESSVTRARQSSYEEDSANQVFSGLTDFLMKNMKNTKYLIAVPDARTAESIILETGEPVMAVGGFSGNDKILTVDRLKQMVKNGEVRYFLLGGRALNQNSDIASWVKENGTSVNINGTITTATSEKGTEKGNEDQRDKGLAGSVMLYDLTSAKG